MLDILAERRFPADEVVALASARSIGTEISFGDKVLKCKALENFDFSGTDICLMSAGGTVSKEWSPKIAAQGCVVIDNSSAWRYDSNVPLIVPEVNADAIAGFSKRNIIANPNCSTAQLVVALKPLHDKAKIKRVVVSTYQSVSGAGKKGVNQMEDEIAGRPVREKKFTHPIAYNALPHIDVFMEDGYTKEELKMKLETKKIMHADIKVSPTTVRIPTAGGHSEAVNVEFEKPCTAEQVRTLLEKAPGIIVQDDPKNNVYPMPINAFDHDEVFVGRIRKDETVESGVNLWVVSDNVRKGAATNAVQIAELLIKNK
jgi:aspartate-semialdehyde dehydrogenase